MIERIQVEEGFLCKLDITFSPGLNVLIGPRGVGKTSVVELIRFCLGLDAFTEEAGIAARKHALSVLGSGQVTLTVQHEGHRSLVSRTAEEDAPRFTGSLPSVVVIGQNDIEAIAQILHRSQGGSKRRCAASAQVRSLAQIPPLGGTLLCGEPATFGVTSRVYSIQPGPGEEVIVRDLVKNSRAARPCSRGP